MKKTLLMTALLLAGLCFASCEKDDTTDTQNNPTENPNTNPNPDPGTDPDPAGNGFNANGASTAVFSVGEGETVRFSKGNLQYQASTGTWRFAENQYDCIGADNNQIADDNENWIDLFGYGTSGWNSGAQSYQPYSTNSSYSNYLNKDLTGAYAEADWGVYNAISNGGNRAGMWRTLTKQEWTHLLLTRSASTIGNTDNARYAKATVCGKKGLIIFPDSYTNPDGVDMPTAINNSGASFNANTYAPSHFAKMQAAGAIFLPAGGYRSGYQILEREDFGHYWSTSVGSGYSAYEMVFNAVNLTVTDVSRNNGCSVRLVQDVE